MSLFDIESKKEELKKLEEQTQQESFWQQDTSISSKVLAKIKELKHKIDEFELEVDYVLSTSNTVTMIKV